MSFLEWIRSSVQQQAVHLLREDIPLARTDEQVSDAPLKAGESYIRLWLSEMFLKHNQKWFRSQYPVAYSTVTLSVGSQPAVELANVAGPLKLPNLSAPQLGKVVSLNFQLTPLLPFGGGTVQVAAGLLALAGDNKLLAFLGTMEQITGFVCGPQISSALKIAGVVADGVDSLVQSAAGSIHLGMQDTFVSAGGGGNVLRPGYIAVVLATTGQLDPAQLWVKKGQLCHGASLAAATPLAGFTYMLFRIEARSERDDWDQITSIAEPFDKAIQALPKDEAQAKEYLRTAIVTAWQSPDLTRLDRRRVAKLIHDEFEAARQSLGGLGLVEGTKPTLASVMAKPTAEEWARDPPPVSLDALLAP